MPPKAVTQASSASHEADASHLLPFQRSLLSELLPPPEAAMTTGDALLILARGLGMRSIVATLVSHIWCCSAARSFDADEMSERTRRSSTQLRIYDAPDHLVLVVNATSEEEKSFSEEVGMRMNVVGFEMPAQTR